MKTSSTEGFVETNRMELDAARSQKGAYALGLLRRACAIWRWCLVHRPSWWPEGIVLQEQTPEKNEI